MRKFRTKSPYDKDGKTNFKYTNGKSGVYLIYKDSKLMYVGMSGSNLYKTMYRHFQSWEDSTQIRTTYNGKSTRNKFTCRVVLCSPSKAASLEKMIIIKHKPKDNPIKYLLFKPMKRDVKVLNEFIGTPVESCPF